MAIPALGEYEIAAQSMRLGAPALMAARSTFVAGAVSSVAKLIDGFGILENASSTKAANDIKRAMDEAEAMFKPNGELTQAAIENSILLPLKLNGPEIKQILSKQPGNLANWGKYETTSIHSAYGLARIHFYYNPVTGNAYYGLDFKVIFDHQSKWDLETPKNFTMGPSY